MARPNKKRQRELKQDAFRDTTLGYFDQLGDRLEGKGRTILYALGAIVAIGILAFAFSAWRARQADRARTALGRAIEIQMAKVDPSPSPSPAVQAEMTFPTERARAERAIEEFQKVAANSPAPYNELAKYFLATNLLVTDRARGISELENLSKNGDKEISARAKFALAQAREADGQYDQARNLYSEIVKEQAASTPLDSVYLRLASVYEKQGNKEEAAKVLFSLVERSRKAIGKDQKPVPQSSAAREAAQKLETLDPALYAKLPPDPSLAAGSPALE